MTAGNWVSTQPPLLGCNSDPKNPAKTRLPGTVFFRMDAVSGFLRSPRFPRLPFISPARRHITLVRVVQWCVIASHKERLPGEIAGSGTGTGELETGVLIVASGHQDPHSSLLCWPQEIGRCGAGCAQIDAGRGRRVAPSCVGVLGDCCVAVVSQACCAFPALAQIRKFQSGYVLAGCLCKKPSFSAPGKRLSERPGVSKTRTHQHILKPSEMMHVDLDVATAFAAAIRQAPLA